MTHFRFRWRKLGGHVHVNVWSGTERDTTHGRNGELVFRENEWADLVKLLRDGIGVGAMFPVEIIQDSIEDGAA